MIWDVRRGKAHSQEFADCGYPLRAAATLPTTFSLWHCVQSAHATAMLSRRVVSFMSASYGSGAFPAEESGAQRLYPMRSASKAGPPCLYSM